MTDDLNFVLMATLIFIAFIFWVSGKQNKRSEMDAFILDHMEWEKQHAMRTIPQTKNEAKSRIKSKAKSSEIIDTLDWMLANQIIDTKQYNNLMVKCLPFFE